jgi:hypothetical protein
MPTVADLIEQMPLPYDECKESAVVFDAALCQNLVNAQAWYGDGRFQASPVPLTDGRWMLPGSLLSEVPVGLYGVPFQRLNYANFALIEVLPMSEVLPLFYADDAERPVAPSPEEQPPEPEPGPEQPAE